MTSSASKLTRIVAPGCPSDKTFTRLLEGLLSDEELQALQAHGDGCAACGRTLAELARSMMPGQGDWLGERYQLLEPVGIGGMGVVYTAFDTKLQRKVAVKRLRELAVAASADKRRARFLREAQLLASLSHPNVLTVHDVGGVDPELYVVMELVDGWPMSRWITEADPRPDWRGILDVYEQVGRGLSAAHRLGVVHRDVKPENILVARNGRVLIGDFGLAGLAEAGGGTPDPGRHPDRSDADGNRAGHARVHGARAARRQAGRHAVGPVFVLRVAVRVVARAPAIPGANGGRDRGGDARGPPGGGRRSRPARRRSRRRARAGRRSTPAASVHGRAAGCAGGRAGAAPDQAARWSRGRWASCWPRPPPPRSSRRAASRMRIDRRRSRCRCRWSCLRRPRPSRATANRRRVPSRRRAPPHPGAPASGATLPPGRPPSPPRAMGAQPPGDRPALLLDLADGSSADRKGADCLARSTRCRSMPGRPR